MTFIAVMGGACSHSTTRTSATSSGRTTSSTAGATTTVSAAGPLAGKTVVIDPGHNGGNGSASAVINKPVWNGRAPEACDTTGAATASGYAEHTFNWKVGQYLKIDLERAGARVVLTRPTDTGVGPCITERAAIGNRERTDAAVSIHADGGPVSGRGFAILEPVADGPNDSVIESSRRLGDALKAAFLATGMPISTYDGVNGIQPRNDLAGVNLTSVPKVFVECGNLNNDIDAALLMSTAWQRQAADALAKGLTSFLVGPSGG